VESVDGGKNQIRAPLRGDQVSLALTILWRALRPSKPPPHKTTTKTKTYLLRVRVG